MDDLFKKMADIAKQQGISDEVKQKLDSTAKQQRANEQAKPKNRAEAMALIDTFLAQIKNGKKP